MGNILSDCVNSSGPSSIGCSMLFTAVTPTFAPLTTSTPATAASDIFQAAVYMSLNPTSTNSTASTANLTSLIGLQTGFPAFGGGLSGAPTDWTLAIQYSGTGVTYTSSVAVDGNGDLWFSNANNTGGVVMLNGGTGTAGGTVGITGGVIGFYTTLSSVTASQTRQVAIDLNGKAWFEGFAANTGDSKYYLFRANSTGVEGTFPLPAGTTQPYAVAIDPVSGNVFGTAESVNMLTTSATATTGTIMTVKTSLVGNCTNSTISIDASSVAYVPCGGSNNVYEFTTNNSTTVASSPFASSTLNSPYGSAIDGLGRLWIANNGAGSIAHLSASGSSGTFTGVTNSCLQGPRFLAIDGNNNVWVTNGNGIGTGSTNFTICEFNSSGTLISNSTGYGLHGLNTARGIAIDPSGNVWVSNYNTLATSVTEIVGAAVPSATPLVYAIKNSKVGTRP
jgi:streptogramin lyase